MKTDQDFSLGFRALVRSLFPNAYAQVLEDLRQN